MFAKMRSLNGRHRSRGNGAMYMRVRTGVDGENKSDDDDDGNETRLDSSLVISVDGDTIGDNGADMLQNSHAVSDLQSSLSSHTLGSDAVNSSSSAKDTIGSESISVRLLEVGKKERRVVLEPEWTVSRIKQEYFASEMKEELNVRLIVGGAILRDDSVVSSLPRLKEGSSIHVAISKHRGLQSLPNTIGLTETSNEGCGPDGFVSDEQLARMLADEERRSVGLAPLFAEAARNGERRSFSSLFDVPSPMMANGNSLTDRRRAELARFQDNCDFFCGLMMGGLLGIWVFLLLAFNRRYSRSRRFRMGILLGVMANIFLSGLSDHSRQGSNHSGDSDSSSAHSGSSGASGNGADANHPPPGATTSKTS